MSEKTENFSGKRNAKQTKTKNQMDILQFKNILHEIEISGDNFNGKYK
jgi:hypothetical protein